MTAPAQSPINVASIRQGNHSCCLYQTQEERRALLASLSLRSLEQRGRLLYIFDSQSADALSGFLSEAGTDVDKLTRSHQITLFKIDHSFEPDQLLALLRAEIASSKSEGSPLQIMCEMPHPAGGHHDASKVMELESKLDALLSGSDCNCTCFYDMSTTDSTMLLGILATHPAVIVESEPCDNLYYLPSHQSSEAGRPAVTLRQRLANLATRKRLENALRESEARFRSLVEPNIVGIMSTEGDRVVDANDAFLKTIGYTREDLLQGKLRWPHLTPPDYRDHDVAAVKEMEASGSCVPFEKEYVRKDGSRVPILLGMSLLSKKPLKTVCFVLDITAHKRAESAQRFLAEAGTLLASSLDYETTLQSVLHSAVPFLADWCVVDILQDGSVQRVAVSSSDPSREIILRELAWLYPQPAKTNPVVTVLSTSRPKIYPDVSDSLLKRLARDERSLQMLHTLEARSAMVVPLAARGCTFGAITLATSESGRRYGAADFTLAQELARRAALAVDNARLYRESQQAIQARDEFLSVASHELKTPITSLRGFAQLTTRQLDKEGVLDPQRLRRALEVIDQQSDRLSRLVTQLLDVSRIQAGHLSLDPRNTDLCSLVRAVVATAQERSARHTIRVQAPAQMHAMVDPLRLEQVVANLIDNAIKYSPDGGPVDIEVSDSGHDSVRIVVADTGIGITPEHRHLIFDRFYQAHADGHYGGIGLGLYISRQIVNLHGGVIEVECPPQGGTRFVVSLPANFRPRGK